MKPRDPKYAAIPLPEAPHLDAGIAYVAERSPISDPYALAAGREDEARRDDREHQDPLGAVETIHEGNPQQILDRKERVSLPPLLIMQGALDDNVLPSLQEKFAATYRVAVGTASWRFSRAVSTSGWTSPGR